MSIGFSGQPEHGAPTVTKLSNDWNTSRHESRGWPQFLESIKIDGLRGWAGQAVEFRYPFVAIAGENGSGKSTVLKAAAAAYRNVPGQAKTFYPDDFFPNTPWETVQGVALTYRFRRGDAASENILRKPTKRWRGMPERPERAVFFLDISRTQPIDTLIGYGKIAKLAAFTGTEIALSGPSAGILSRVMSRSYASGRVIRQSGKNVGILNQGGTEAYSPA